MQDYNGRITGEVVNTNDFEINTVYVPVICRDSGGNIIGGEYGSLTDVAPLSITPFDISVFYNSSKNKDAASFEVYAKIWR
jgi:hypothetical protein